MCGADAAGARARTGQHAPLARDVGAVPLDHERRADLLRVRVGIAVVRGGVPRDLLGTVTVGAAGRDPLADAMAAVPLGVRRRADQAERGPLLAGSHVPLLPPRNAADAESVQPLVPSAPEAAAPDRSGRQSLRSARWAFGILRFVSDS